MSPPTGEPKKPAATALLFLATLLWLLLFRSTLFWLFRVAPALLLLLPLPFLFLAVKAAHKRPFLLRITLREQPLALACALCFSIAAVVFERVFFVHNLTALAFCLGSYSLLRLYLGPRDFRRGLPVLLFLLCLLPLREQLDAYIGFPLRVATASSVQDLFTLFHIPSTSAEAILVLENGVAHVDLPCSGIKSLWTGALFFFAATLILDRKMDLGWLAIFALFFALLIAANATRVSILVLLILCAQQPLVAESLHVPLGALGFLAAATVTLFLLRRTGSKTPRVENEPPGPALTQRSLSFFLGGLTVLCAVSLVPRKNPQAISQPGTLARPSLPQNLELTELPLTDVERGLFFSHGRATASKWRFKKESLSGSLLIVISRSFRAHHAPEVCLSAAGLHIDGIERTHIDSAAFPPFPARILRIADSGQPRLAFYWFQAAGQTTDSLLERTLSELRLSHPTWALVTVLFDSAEGADAVREKAVLSELHQTLATHLGGTPP